MNAYSRFVVAVGLLNAAIALLMLPSASAAAEARPNIVWIVVEDMSRPFGCYGETAIETPNVDRLAAEGALFTRAFVTAPVCSAARSALITGMYQTTIGAHQHRSGRGEVKLHRPDHVRLVPEMFHEAGYYVTNGSKLADEPRLGAAARRIAKTDYNFEFDASCYDGNDWAGRAEGQPFFAQIQLSGGKGRTKNTPHPIDPDDVKLPPYYPEHPVILDDWAQYLNSAMNTDIEVGRVLERLEQEGELDNTFVFFITDHGISHARGKQFLYEEGIRIPFVVRGPGIAAGTVREDLVAHIDMAATSLALAGIAIPEYVESRPLFGPGARPRDYVVSARDRCDETVDRIRSVRTARYKYIHNFYPARPYLQPCAYKDKKEILIALREWFDAGRLNRDQMLIMAPIRPVEELYDLDADPNELNNLADRAEHQSTLAKLRGILDRWIEETGDRGQYLEPDAVYDSDMKVYVDGMRAGGGWKVENAAVIEKNIQIMKQWQAEGR